MLFAILPSRSVNGSTTENGECRMHIMWYTAFKICKRCDGVTVDQVFDVAPEPKNSMLPIWRYACRNRKKITAYYSIGSKMAANPMFPTMVYAWRNIILYKLSYWKTSLWLQGLIIDCCSNVTYRSEDIWYIHRRACHKTYSPVFFKEVWNPNECSSKVAVYCYMRRL